jgi:hypothetical protein
MQVQQIVELINKQIEDISTKLGSEQKRIKKFELSSKICALDDLRKKIYWKEQKERIKLEKLTGNA